MKQPPEQHMDDAQQSAVHTKVSALFEIMKNERIEELEITDQDTHIHIKRKGRSAPVVAAPSVVMPIAEAVPAAGEPDKAEIIGETVKSPIMGVLYRAPSPSSPTFVKEGDVVDVGKTLCIVEAMKVMNEIKADGRMKILKILVENGKPISAEQDLILIERA